MNKTNSPTKKKHIFDVKETRRLIFYMVFTLCIVIAACWLKWNHGQNETLSSLCEVYANIFSSFCGSLFALICGRILDSKDYPKTRSMSVKRRSTKSIMNRAYLAICAIVVMVILTQILFPEQIRWIYNVGLYGLCSAAIGLAISMVERMLHFEAEDAKHEEQETGA